MGQDCSCYFLFLDDKRDVVMAVVSIGLMLAGIFLIFLWVMVDQLCTQLKQVMANKQSQGNSKRPNSSLIHLNKPKSSSSLSTKSLMPMKNKRHHHRQKEPSRKSRSLEHILDLLQGVTTLYKLE